ncbi:hypothetical protein Hanom_Chr07g00593281 [Helianthus anomalus]
MSMYGFDASFYDYGFSDPAITRSFFGNPIDFGKAQELPLSAAAWWSQLLLWH